MRSLPLPAAFILLFAASASAQELGRRTTSPEAMVAQMSRPRPREEMRALVAAAEAHPLGTADNPVRVGGPDGEHAYLARLRCADGAAPADRRPARRRRRRLRLGGRRL